MCNRKPSGFIGRSGMCAAAAVFAAGFSGVAHAQQSSNARVIYRLTPNSSFQQGCFDPCMCPLLEQRPLRGTFVLTHQSSQNGTETFAVEDVNWTAAYDDPELRITGSGTYTISTPGVITVLHHRLQLDLKVGEEPVAHFDSGWVIGPSMPHITLTVSRNNMFCFDTVFVIEADPVPASEIQTYAMMTGSTYQRGCYDPCDCMPPGPPQPVVGSFRLVPLFDNSLFAEYAVIDVHWRVLSAIPSVPADLPITGVGSYRIGGEFAIQQRMRADLRVGDEEPSHFDSGLVVGGSGFPDRIETTISINNLVCFDTVIHVLAKRQNADGDVCGGIAGIGCDEGEFCKYAVGECCCDFQGVCRPIPEACIAVWDPVCGCDGQTYGNECEADRAGVAVDHFGECRTPCETASGHGCVKVIIDMDPNTPGYQSTIAVPPGSRTVRGIGVYIYDPNEQHSIWGIGYLGGLDRGIAFGHTPSNTNPQGRVAGIVAHAGAPVNPGNTPMVSPAMDKGFGGAEVQYVEFGASQPAVIPAHPAQPIFTVDVILQNAGIGDTFNFQVLDFVRIWTGGSGGAFSTQSAMSLDTGGDVVPDGTVSIYGIDADTAIPIPPAAFYVDFIDGGPSQVGSPNGGATITVAAGVEPIPAVTAWGAVVMVLLVLSAGTVVLHRARRPA